MIIQELDLFGGIDDDIVEEIVGVMETQSYEAGDVVFKAGDPADDFYILVSGAVSLHIGDAPKAASVALKQGNAFGWSSLAGRDVYSSTVACAEPSQLYRINKDNLDRVLRQHPATGMLFYKRLAGLIGERVITCHQKLAKLQGA
jgi:CRP-like cAMP-binding protein